jgi:hypothetical protein
MLNFVDEINSSIAACYNILLFSEKTVMEDLRFKRFINEIIDAQFLESPLLEKKPGCPSGFTWRGKNYQIRDLISEWHDYRRRGRMARNMQPKHAATAETRGSWGVGQDYYRVRTTTGEIFDIYFDRAPKDIDNRKGFWFIYRELEDNNE